MQTAGTVALQPYRPPPPRPGYGTKGTPIQLKVNLFPVRFPRGELYHYDVTITPTCPKWINRIVFDALMNKYSKEWRQRPVFDGSKNMYCRQQLRIPQGQVGPGTNYSVPWILGVCKSRTAGSPGSPGSPKMRWKKTDRAGNESRLDSRVVAG